MSFFPFPSMYVYIYVCIYIYTYIHTYISVLSSKKTDNEGKRKVT